VISFLVSSSNVARSLSDINRGARSQLPLRRLDAETQDLARLHSALAVWIEQICETHALLCLVDDAQRLEERSLAWLVSLALNAPDLRVQLAVTVETSALASPSAPLNMLSTHSTSVELQPLTRLETQRLLGSVFGSVPHLAPLAERLHGLAHGSPQESLLLTQHLVDTGVVHYQDGEWTLPAELRPGDLPATASDALRARPCTAGASALARTNPRFARHALTVPRAAGHACG